jgi:hypothetical protein
VTTQLQLINIIIIIIKSYTAVDRSSFPRLWTQDIQREGEDDCWVEEAVVEKTTDQKAEEPGETIRETSRSVRSERVNKWPNFMLA